MLSTTTLGALRCSPTSGLVVHKTQRIWGGAGVCGVLGCNLGVATVRCRLDPVCAAQSVHLSCGFTPTAAVEGCASLLVPGRWHTIKNAPLRLRLIALVAGAMHSMSGLSPWLLATGTLWATHAERGLVSGSQNAKPMALRC